MAECRLYKYKAGTQEYLAMNTAETAKLTGIPLELLIKMRNRNQTITLQSGPPYMKKVDKNGIPYFVYHKTQVMAWLAKRNVLITAAEAAQLIGVTRVEVLKIAGIKRFDFRRYLIIVEPKKNRFLMVLKRRKKVA